MIIVVSGPGGVGKGTIVEELVLRDPALWLSRSWTTREQRPSETDDAYVFTDTESFEQRIAAGGFLEWTEFLGNYYGTPTPEPVDGRDIVLEIEVDGAQQVKQQHPDAMLIFVLPPSREEQERRLRKRGDREDKVHARLKKAEEEEPIGRALADHVVVNDDLERTIDEMLEIIEAARSRTSSRTVEQTRSVLIGGRSVLIGGRSRYDGNAMALEHDTMINPPIEQLLDKVDSKFSLVTLAARRARNINSYFNQLGDGLGGMIPPQVSSTARKPLSIGFEEIAADKIVWTEAPEEPEVPELEYDADAEAQAMADAAAAESDES